MFSDPSTPRPGAPRARLSTFAIALLATAMLSAPGQARSDRSHHWGGPGGWIERHAEELGLDETTLAEIEQIVAASREEGEAIYAEHRRARDAMHDLLDQEEPDLAAVMKQAEVIGEIDVRKHKHRIRTMLEIRSQLSPEQRAQLRELKDEMRERKGERRGHGKRRGHGGCDHGRGGDPHESGAPAEQ